ncbi:hypothetical protein K8S19_01655 [bacterium]|nr:hypothetical protein [bacterium]
MKQLAILMLFLVIQSCTYRMHGLITVDSFTEPNRKSISNELEDGQIYVHINPEAKNILLEKEIKYKIKNILQYLGYKLTEYPDEAKYHLLFIYGEGKAGVRTSERTTVFNYYNSWATVTNRNQYNENYHSLILDLVDGEKLLGKKIIETLWMCQSSHIIERDYRLETNYLIINSLEMFGENTRRIYKYSDTREELLEVIDPILNEEKSLEELYGTGGIL